MALEPTRAPGAEGPEDGTWAVIARFANAAEAGYFADELDYALDVEPRLDCRDDFDAVHHHWRSRFVLSVPAQHAERARDVLTNLLAGTPAEPVTREEQFDSTGPIDVTRLRPRCGTARTSRSPVKWAPLFLTLAAGSLAFWHGKKPPAQRQPGAPQDALRVELVNAPGLHDAPWVQTSAGGLRRELHFRAQDGDALLREDRDGDGVFEREFSIPTR